MKDYIFGMKVAESTAGTASDFDTATASGDGNPYGRGYFEDLTQKAKVNNLRVTSIPSPYARMHITDIAFRELISGSDRQNLDKHLKQGISDDYLRAMSHCLDIFELLYRFKDLDLVNKGITIERLQLVEVNENPEDPYIQTLVLYREQYMRTINQRKRLTNGSYLFDFTSLYLLKHNGKTFGATSPFTGFFAKADCDLSGISFNGHKYLTGIKADWVSIQERDAQFLEFLYLLLKTQSGLQYIFENLFKAIQLCIPADKQQQLDNKTADDFNTDYPQFNFGGESLPEIRAKQTLYLRPYGLDCSYLKYMLYCENPIDFKIDQTDYNDQIGNRRFNGKICPWIAVNDVLSEGLFVLPYDIDNTKSTGQKDNKFYSAVCYTDQNEHEHRRCLLPLKKEVLDYFQSFQALEQNIKIKKYDDSHFGVTLSLPLMGAQGTAELHRDYYMIDSKECEYPNGILISLHDPKSFSFGIYPFIKTRNFKNIYKIMFYNSFKDGYKLNFYYQGQNGAVAYVVGTEVQSNTTNLESKNQQYPVNCTYYNVESNQRPINNDFASIDFIELTVTCKKNKGTGAQKSFDVTTIIRPNLIEPTPNGNNVTVAVDLGTSNTYIAYQDQGTRQVQTISTKHQHQQYGTWNELVFLNDMCTKQDDINVPEKVRHDLCLKNDKGGNTSFSTESIPAQFSEFLPTSIGDQTQLDVFSFPIPTVINRLNSYDGNGNLTPGKNVTQGLPLVNSAIPFAYYTFGKRDNAPGISYDCIADGTFKWFFAKNYQGNWVVDSTKENEFNCFLHELLFIVRSNFLCQGYDLNNVELIWTYPLSFHNNLVTQYTNAWNNAFRLYFNSNSNAIMCTSESSTPLFHCMQNPAMQYQFTVLMDIGGGSSDCIGYKNGQRLFTTSFGFAGNALYLEGALNDSRSPRHHNLFACMASDPRLGQLNVAQSLIPGMTPIQSVANAESVSSIMNYGFSNEKTSQNFQNMINYNADPQFLLTMHATALCYHVAQLCKIKSPEEMPLQVYLTGNGSKLFNLLTDQNLVARVFEKVYGKNGRVVCVHNPEPKAATSKGAIAAKVQGQQIFDGNTNVNRVVLLGDAETVFDNAFPPAIGGPLGEELASKIEANIKEYIDVLYELIGGDTGAAIPKAEMLNCMKIVGGYPNVKTLDPASSESLFFQWISLLMEQVSAHIVQKKNYSLN